jgi:hypothetical protein
LKRERKIQGFLEQSHISKRNFARLRALASSKDTRIANLAALVLEVATVARYRRRRIRNLARQGPRPPNRIPTYHIGALRYYRPPRRSKLLK